MSLQMILESAKKGKTKAFFDMDGVMVEIVFTTNVEYRYDDKRPLETVIDSIKTLHDAGVELYVLSQCHWKKGREQKEKWLDKYAPFIKPENRIIITYKETDNPHPKPMENHKLKAWYIKSHINRGETVYFIEDTFSNMLGMAEENPDVINIHVTSFFK